MILSILDRDELKRIRKLLTTLDNKTVSFPVGLYRGEDRTVAFMEGNMDREFSVRTTQTPPPTPPPPPTPTPTSTPRTTQHYQMSDRPGARMDWIKKDLDETKASIDALIARKKEGQSQCSN